MALIDVASASEFHAVACNPLRLQIEAAADPIYQSSSG